MPLSWHCCVNLHGIEESFVVIGERITHLLYFRSLFTDRMSCSDVDSYMGRRSRETSEISHAWICLRCTGRRVDPCIQVGLGSEP